MYSWRMEISAVAWIVAGCLVTLYFYLHFDDPQVSLGKGKNLQPKIEETSVGAPRDLESIFDDISKCQNFSEAHNLLAELERSNRPKS